MGLLGRFLRLPAAERRLAFRALVTVVCVRVALWVLPFRSVRRVVARLGRRTRSGVGASVEEERVAWAVRSAASLVPGASCLTQALAAKALLSRAGGAGSLRIGVAREGGGRLRAHAWVESGGRVLLGDHDLERFQVLPPLEGE